MKIFMTFVVTVVVVGMHLLGLGGMVTWILVLGVVGLLDQGKS